MKAIKYETEAEILQRVKEIQAKQGELDMELDLLWVELQLLRNPNFKGWTKHPWG